MYESWNTCSNYMEWIVTCFIAFDFSICKEYSCVSGYVGRRVKAHYNGLLWKSQWQFFLSESSIVALYSNLFEKLGKSGMKN
jgi:hypothetical protein